MEVSWKLKFKILGLAALSWLLTEKFPNAFTPEEELELELSRCKMFEQFDIQTGRHQFQVTVMDF